MPEPPNADLLDRLAEDFPHDVTLGTMFRSPGLRVGGRIFAFLGHGGELILKLPADRAHELVTAGTAQRVTMGTRTMREWIELPTRPDRDATLTLWRTLAHEAHQYVNSLPAP